MCPKCGKAPLYEDDDLYKVCPVCGLKQRPINKIWCRDDTEFYYLRQNVERAPKGSKVDIDKINHQSICDVEEPPEGSWVLKQNFRCIAFSMDLEDLVIFAVEHDWWFEGPPEVVAMANQVADILSEQISSNTGPGEE